MMGRSGATRRAFRDTLSPVTCNTPSPNAYTVASSMITSVMKKAAHFRKQRLNADSA